MVTCCHPLRRTSCRSGFSSSFPRWRQTNPAEHLSHQCRARRGGICFLQRIALACGLEGVGAPRLYFSASLPITICLGQRARSHEVTRGEVDTACFADPGLRVLRCSGKTEKMSGGCFH